MPLFDWNHPENEACGVWLGFLRAPRLYWPLLSAIKKEFPKTESDYKQLGNYVEQYANFITFLSLNRNGTFTDSELIDATCNLPQEGLKYSALALAHTLEGAGEQKDEYWRNRVLPYIKKIWPQSVKRIDPYISENFGRLCIAAEKVFPSALQELKPWLKPVQYPSYLISELNETNLCKLFPADTLEFLNVIIGKDTRMLTEDLENCLDIIKSTKPQLAKDSRFKRLMEFCLRKKTF